MRARTEISSKIYKNKSKIHPETNVKSIGIRGRKMDAQNNGKTSKIESKRQPKSSNMQQKLERFHSKSCRAILGINMWEVSMYKVKYWTILARVGVPSMEKIIHYRRLAWMHKIAIMPSNRNPKKFLNAWISSKRPVGRPNITTRDSFLKSLHFYDFKCPNGKLDQWIPEARDYTK